MLPGDRRGGPDFIALPRSRIAFNADCLERVARRSDEGDHSLQHAPRLLGEHARSVTLSTGGALNLNDASTIGLVTLSPALRAALDGGIVVTPTQRLARELERAYDRQRLAATIGTWRRVRALAWDAFIASSYAEAHEGSVADRVLTGIAADTVARDAAPDPEVRDYTATFRSAWDIAHSYDLFQTPAAFATTDNGRLFLDWNRAFDARCRDQGWLIGAAVVGALQTRLQAAAWRPPPVTLYAFDVLSPLQRGLLRSLEQAGCVVQHLAPTHAQARSQSRSQVRVVRAADARHELATAAAWARERRAEIDRLDPASAGAIGIVVAGGRLPHTAVRRQFGAFFNDPDGPALESLVNFGGGTPISEVGICRVALDVLEWSATPLDHRRLATLLRSPYTSSLRYGRPLPSTLPQRISLEAIAARTATRDYVPRAFVDAVREAPRLQLPDAWIDSFSAWLQQVGWGDDNLGSYDYQARASFVELLEECARLGQITGAIDLFGMVGVVAQAARARVFAPQSEDAAVQVLGPLETTGLQFEHLWITGLEDLNWPRMPRPNPFLPTAILRDRHVPRATIDTERQWCEAMQRGWLASAHKVVFSYAAADAEQSYAPSPLLPQRVVRDAAKLLDDPGAATFGHPHMRPRPGRHARPALEAFVDGDAGSASLPPDRPTHGGASLLKDQGDCPFRAFARHRLRIRDEPDPHDLLNALDRGNLAHQALAGLLVPGMTRDTLAELDEATLASRVGAMTLPILTDVPMVFQRAEAARLVQLLAHWFATEREQRQQPFRVEAVETSQTVQIGPLTLSIRADRIDATDAGAIVIDYKTGKENAKSAWALPTVREPQLPLYASALPDASSAAGIAFALVRDAPAWLSVGPDDGDIQPDALGAPAFPTLLALWRERLERLASDFANGDARVDPRPGACQYCELSSLCRIYAQRPAFADNGAS